MKRVGQHLGWTSGICALATSLALTLAVLVLVVVQSQSAQAHTFSVLSNFTGASGAYPYGGLMQDSAGTLYGTTYSGGASSAGTIFAVIYGAEPVLHSFSGSDGSIPKGGLIRGPNGVLYGTTEEGGASGLGTVFALSRLTHVSVDRGSPRRNRPRGAKYRLSVASSEFSNTLPRTFPDHEPRLVCGAL